MACVLTLALVEGEQVAIGHVGDSRLYLIAGGAIRKVTSDHSPVGEIEDAGEIAKRMRWRTRAATKCFATWEAVRVLPIQKTSSKCSTATFRPRRRCSCAAMA